MDRLRSKFVGSLVGTGVGDSLGAGGKSYTDDDAEPRRGYGPGPPSIFKMIKSGLSRKAAAERMYPGGSYGNGSAMRVAPVGLFYYDDSTKLKEISFQSRQIIHTHPLGMEGAALQAYAVALATRTEPHRLNKRNFLQKLSDLAQADACQTRLGSIEMLLAEAADRQQVIRELGNTVKAFNPVPISMYSFLVNCGFRATLDYALNLGGDRDTIASMAGAVAGACYGIEDIPEEWKDGLENREYIEGLAEKLWQLKLKGEGAQ